MSAIFEKMPFSATRGIVRRFLGMVAVIACAQFATLTARADDPEFLTFGAGVFDFSGKDTAGLISLEYVDDRKWLWALKPMTGFFINHHAGAYGYAGLALDLYFGRRWVVTPSFAPGLYYEGSSADLGHVVEFRSAVKVAYRLDDRSRIGVDISHISNAGLDKRNPGANQIMLIYSVPFSRDGK
ncbi:MAG: hypothetical protein RL477_427 [Pseudomonadota bacterium]